MHDNKNQKPISPGKVAMRYLLDQIAKIAAAVNVAISPETVDVYAEELSSLTKAQVDTARARTIREWDKPSQMPTIPFILERIRSCSEEADQKLLGRPDKPADWVPLEPGEFERMVVEAASRKMIY